MSGRSTRRHGGARRKATQPRWADLRSILHEPQALERSHIVLIYSSQLLYTYAPPLQSLFETEGVPLGVWPWRFLGGLIFFLVVEAEKAIIRATRSRAPTLGASAPA